MTIIKLGFTKILLNRLQEESLLIQVVLGPRQVGKTTGIKQVLNELEAPTHYASADKTISTPASWLLEQWQVAKRMGHGTVLAIDEIQKIPNWSETIKSLWDSQAEDLVIKLVLLGSSSLRLQEGLTESLTGRFEIVRVHHWNLKESSEAFGWNLETFLKFGGYPGSTPFINDFDRWYSYIKDAVIDTVIGKDILELRQVSKPALFRQAFEILSSYPAQEISYTKLLGQLQDKGNTDLIKRYIELFEGAYLFKALQKYSAKAFKKRSSSPKILPLCPALSSINYGPEEVTSGKLAGRIFELAVGAELVRLPGELYYWRRGNVEVDYIHCYKGKIFAIEVKSGRVRKKGGLSEFSEAFPDSIPIIISREDCHQFFENPKDFLSSTSK